jgi:ubiquinone/menaquinone biosynthesis C-methylase UbiE
MEQNSGIYGLLNISLIYKLIQNLARERYCKKWLAENYWDLKGGEKVIDFGCGPGNSIKFIPKDVEYIGYDINADYIRTAEKKFGNRATFIVGTAHDFINKPDNRMNNSDIVLITGVLHHVEDNEVLDIFRLAERILAPGGRLICLEPTYLVHQGCISKWFLNRDRGRNIRTEDEWKNLLNNVFNTFSTNITTGLLRIPYTHIIIVCRKKI